MKFTKIERGWYANEDGTAAVMSDGYTRTIGLTEADGSGVNAGAAHEWAAVVDPQGRLRSDSEAGDNLSWFPTKREAIAFLELRTDQSVTEQTAEVSNFDAGGAGSTAHTISVAEEREAADVHDCGDRNCAGLPDLRTPTLDVFAAKIPPVEAQRAVVRAIAVAGSIPEWDSETIEIVLDELKFALRHFGSGVPDPFNSSNGSEGFWQDVYDGDVAEWPAES